MRTVPYWQASRASGAPGPRPSYRALPPGLRGGTLP